VTGAGGDQVERRPVHAIDGPAGQMGERCGDVDRPSDALDDPALGHASAGQQQRRS
jgi:hypothetical protein